MHVYRGGVVPRGRSVKPASGAEAEVCNSSQLREVDIVMWYSEANVVHDG